MELLVNLLSVVLMEEILDQIPHLQQEHLQLVVDNDKDAKRTFLIIILYLWKTVIEIFLLVNMWFDV